MNIKKYFTIVFCVLGVCLAVISGVIVANRMLSPIIATDPDSEYTVDPPDKDRSNVLVLGVDGGEMRSDTIMLFSLDNKNKKLSVLSIPRDTRILDGNAYDKITHMYGTKRHEQATIDAVKRIVGIPIHYVVTVDFKGFREAIDILDGVYVDVPHVPNAWSKGRRGMYYTDPEQNLYIELPEGEHQLLDGKQSEHFVRFRYGYAEGDVGRIQTQQYFLKELLKQKLNIKYISKAPELYKQISKCINTNFSAKDIMSHLIVIKDLDPESVETFQLPGYSANASTRYGTLSCFIYNQAETDALIQQHFVSGAVPNE